jgi:hypothetical protein
MLDATRRLNSNMLTARKEDSERIILPLATYLILVIKKLTKKTKRTENKE